MKTILNTWKYLNYLATLILFVVSANRIYPIIYESITQDQLQMKLSYVIYGTIALITFVFLYFFNVSEEKKLTKKKLFMIISVSLIIYPVMFFTVLPYILFEVTAFYILLGIFVSMVLQLVIKKMNMRKEVWTSIGEVKGTTK